MLNFIVSCEREERAQTLHLNFVSTMETVLWGGQNQNVKFYVDIGNLKVSLVTFDMMSEFQYSDGKHCVLDHWNGKCW